MWASGPFSESDEGRGFKMSQLQRGKYTKFICTQKYIHSLKEVRKLINKTFQALMAEDVCVSVVEIPKYPWEAKTPSRCMATKNEITHVLVAEPLLALQH